MVWKVYKNYLVTSHSLNVSNNHPHHPLPAKPYPEDASLWNAVFCFVFSIHEAEPKGKGKILRCPSVGGMAFIRGEEATFYWVRLSHWSILGSGANPDMWSGANQSEPVQIWIWISKLCPEPDQGNICTAQLIVCMHSLFGSNTLSNLDWAKRKEWKEIKSSHTLFCLH